VITIGEGLPRMQLLSRTAADVAAFPPRCRVTVRLKSRKAASLIRRIRIGGGATATRDGESIDPIARTRERCNCRDAYERDIPRAPPPTDSGAAANERRHAHGVTVSARRSRQNQPVAERDVCIGREALVDGDGSAAAGAPVSSR